jgi:menaquinone-dependent protoporphyrinogen oxidase
MSNEVLVAYTTRHETTRAIAAAIVEVLQGAHVEARLEPVEAVGDLRAYRAAVIGCSVFGGDWMPGAHAFLAAHERQLESMPVWLFATGPVEPLPADRPVDVSPDLVGVIERIGPRDVALFAGSLQPHHIGAGLRILAKLSRRSFTEHRDWAAVERWATHIAEALGPAAAPQAPEVKET